MYVFDFNHFPLLCIRYVVSPRDIVVVQPRDAKDKIMWAKNAGHFSLALKLCKEYPNALSAGAIAVIGELYLTSLTSPGEKQDFKLAASLCPQLLEDDADRWDKWVTFFWSNHHVRILLIIVFFFFCTQFYLHHSF